MTKKQRALYTQVLKRDVDAVQGKGGERVRLLNIVMQLRKAANHPYLFDGQEDGPPFLEGEHLVEASGKLVVLDKLLDRLKAGNHRVLIFSQAPPPPPRIPRPRPPPTACFSPPTHPQHNRHHRRSTTPMRITMADA